MEKFTSDDDLTTERDEKTADDVVSKDDGSLSEYDKTVADSFPSSDPPAVP